MSLATENQVLEKEDEGKSYSPPERSNVWLTRAPAAQAIGVSRTTLAAKVRKGEVVSKKEQGVRYFSVSAAAAKAIIGAKQRATDGRAELEIVQAFTAGASVPAIIAALRCSPRILARTLKDLQSALVVARQIRQEEREADEIERVREIETGHPDSPTTWAWCDFLFRGDPDATPPRTCTYAEAKQKFDAWVSAGNAIDSASPHVRQAIESAEAWLVARRIWLAECQRAADRRAREDIVEAHRIKMIVAKEESAERVKLDAQQRRTARLVKAASGKKPRSTRSNDGLIDERTEKENDGPSTEEGST